MGSFFKYLRERADHYSQVYGVHDTPSIADLFQEAATVFWDKVVPKWDSAKSNLVNYSKLWVRQAIERYAFVHAHAYKRETYLKDWHHRFNVAEMEFFKEKGYLPTREELADILDMTVEDIERIEFTKVPNTSLHTTTSKEGYEYDECGIDTLEDMDWVDQLDRLVREEEKAELPDALAELPGRWRQILMTRYFRDDGKLVPFGEIAKGYDVSWQRIEQIEKQAFRRIREHFEAVYSE
jgi:RNA polymerase primary sigma factor